MLALLAAVLGSTLAALPARADGPFSLLALGDTGKRRPFGWTSWGQLAVGQSLAQHHREHPADAILLLGDNFYPDGLEAHELEARIAANLVRPYCPLLALDGACSPAVADACGTRSAERRPVPWLVLLGNHDHDSAESPELQRDRVPCYLPGWDLPRESVALSQLAEGVDLVRYDASELARSGDYAPLERALVRSRGPWRLLAGHVPLVEDDHARAVLEAVRRSGVAVQIHLAGHEHLLELAASPGPVAARIVSGAGSEAREPRYGHGEAAVLFRESRLGFVELRWPRGGQSERVAIDFLAAARWPVEAWSQPELRARFWIDREGRVSAAPRGVAGRGYLPGSHPRTRAAAPPANRRGDPDGQ